MSSTGRCRPRRDRRPTGPRSVQAECLPGIARGDASRQAEYRRSRSRAATRSRLHGHLGGAVDHDPVLGAVEVLLQGEPAARLDHDALHLESLAPCRSAVPAPGPVARECSLRLRTLPFAHRGHQLASHPGRLRAVTSTASGVATTITSSRPTTAVSDAVAAHIAAAGPRSPRRRRRALPAASRGEASQSAAQDPISDQANVRAEPPRRARCAPSPHSRSRSTGTRSKAFSLEAQEIQIAARRRQRLPARRQHLRLALASSSMNCRTGSRKMPLFQR